MRFSILAALAATTSLVAAAPLVPDGNYRIRNGLANMYLTASKAKVVTANTWYPQIPSIFFLDRLTTQSRGSVPAAFQTWQVTNPAPAAYAVLKTSALGTNYTVDVDSPGTQLQLDTILTINGYEWSVVSLGPGAGYR